MQTITNNTGNVSVYTFADDATITATGDNITTPDDWYGCKYNCAADGKWTAVEGWVDPRIEES